MLLVALLAFAACGSTDGGTATDGPASIVGDWFACEDGSCATIIDDGTRFRGDGTFARLDTPGGAVPPDGRLCVRFDREDGTYRWDGSELTLMRPGASDESFSYEIAGNRAHIEDRLIRDSNGGETVVDIDLLRFETHEDPACH
jgi:hypothetical protein